MMDADDWAGKEKENRLPRTAKSGACYVNNIFLARLQAIDAEYRDYLLKDGAY